MRLLAIDDLADNLVSVSALLKAYLPGCEIETASSGAEGIEKARKFQPDTILLDIQMPVMDGFATCKSLKDDPATRHIPVIFLTAQNTDPASRIRGLAIGGDAFLAKPIDPGEMTAQVQAMVRIKKAEDHLRGESLVLEKLVAERTAELSKRVRHLDAMERISHVTLASAEIEDVLGGILDEMLNLFGADRAWFLYPCDPDAPSWSVPIERTRPQWPGAFEMGTVFPTTEADSETFRSSLETPEPIELGPFTARNLPSAVIKLFSVRSLVQVALRPRSGSPWLMGIHHCSESSVHDRDDLQLFKAIAQRVSETLTSLMTLKDLRASNERFQMLAEYAPVGITLTDPSGDCVLTNRVWREMSGLDSEEAAGRGWVKGLHPEDRDAVTKGWYQSIREQGSWRADYRFQNRSGRVTWVEGSAFPLEDGRGSLTGYIGTNVDITERKRTEETQLFLLQCGYEASGEGFFQSLARYLAQTLQMDFVCIDALEGDGLNARTVAVWCDGAFQDNVTYALKDTPCGEVVGKTVCCFPASVCQFFPRDQVLQDLKAESYAGVTLWSHAGKPIGLIAVIARKPLVDRKMVEATLKLVAFRAAGELERKEAEDAIREKMNELSRWHQVTLGREMRILELKREVNELLAEVGKPPRFSDDAVAERPEAHSR